MAEEVPPPSAMLDDKRAFSSLGFVQVAAVPYGIRSILTN
jgi:hypothetical protein